MNILVVSSYLPYPLYSGGHVRLYNILKRLSEKHSITLVCEIRNYQTESDINQLKKFCKAVYTFPRKKQWSMRNIIKTSFSHLPFLLIGHKSASIRQKIKELIGTEKFDLIHIETFYVMQNVPKTLIPTVLVEHNIEYLVYKRYAKTTPFYVRPLLLLDIEKLRYWENFYWKKATRLVAVSKQEKKRMKRVDVQVVPNGVDLDNFKYQISNIKFQKKEKTVLFIGDFKWIQNRNAIEFILKEIWPKLHSELDLKLWVIGKNIPISIKDLTTDENVIFDENAPDDTSKIFQKSDILLAPILVGGGTSFKILEAMASGIPVVTSPLGIEGIEAQEDKDVLLAKTSNEFAAQAEMLLHDENIYKSISHNARKLIEDKYDWKKIVLKLELVYESVFKN